MTRLRSFSTPHKGLRNILSQFTLLAGQTDFSDAAQVGQLKALGNEMFMLLTEHMHTENDFTLRHIEERKPGFAQHELDDHDAVEQIQEALHQRLNALDGTQDANEAHEFYLAAANFQSIYLEHIHHEETDTEKLLWELFTDEELIQHRMEIMQHIPPQIMMVWMKYIVPAQNEPENLEMLGGFKANAPKEAYEGLMGLLQTVMSPERFKTLRTKLEYGVEAFG